MSDKIFEIEVEGQETITLKTSDASKMDLSKNPDGSFHLLMDKKAYRLEVLNIKNQGKEYHLKVDGHLVVAKVNDPIDQLVSKMGLSNFAHANVSEIKAPMPGLVLSVDVKAGQEVSEGQALLILEAMKMENVIKSPVDAVISDVSIKPGDAVEKGQILITF
ncbi:MAG: acetyl-CoA carboxylase biotin carboxyl carrier protein subunit [Bacteroidetes bacterium]|nr:acetyl-CoA carboxylase biotin carboxyl carrier protein subunit [Bacteroidota bacterium]